MPPAIQTLSAPFLAMIALGLSACSNQASENPGVVAPASSPSQTASPADVAVTAEAATADKASVAETAANVDNGDCVSRLPFSRGKTFCSLDEYLDHLEALGAVDLPWWREISPGVYEHVKRMPEAEREIATREELMERFGFKR